MLTLVHRGTPSSHATLIDDPQPSRWWRAVGCIAVTLALCASATASTLTDVVPVVSVDADIVPAGSIVTVSWGNIEAPTATDWVALVPENASDGGWLVWTYTTGQATGSTPLLVPLSVPPGTYQVRLFAHDTSARLAVSTSFTVPAVTVTASPDVVATGATLTVSWAYIGVPSPDDWLALVPANAPDGAFAAWIRATGLRSDSTLFAIPPTVAAGTYTGRLFAGDTLNRIAISNPISITGPGPILTASPVATAPGGTVAADWRNIAAPTQTDVVGLYRATDPDSSSNQQVYATGRAFDSALMTLPQGLGSGTYELRYLSNGTRQVVSNPVAVGSTTDPIVFTERNAVAPGQTLTVSWSRIATPGAANQITLAPVNAPMSQAVVSHSTGSASSGSLDLAIPTTTPAGDYQLRLFANGTANRLAVSHTIHVGPSVDGTPTAVVPGPNASVTATWHGIANPTSTDWIALVPINQSDTTYVAWQYTNGSSDGNLSLPVPSSIPNGRYDLRLFAHDSWSKLAVSADVMRVACATAVTPTQVSLPATGGTNTLSIAAASDCSWTASSSDPWLTVSSAATGIGGGTVTLSAAPNNTGASRIATVAVNNQTVSVTEPAIDPAVTLTKPFSGTTFNHPSSVTIVADVNATSIAGVDFYASGTLIGSSTSAPYQIAWANPAGGTYALSAVAVSTSGAATTSLPVTITISATGSDQGTLGSPVASPSPGVFAGTQLVTLTAAPGAVIHYRTDGQLPNSDSPTFANPIPIAVTTTIVAISTADGWTASVPTIATFHIDTVGPTIVPVYHPARNAAGWNNGPVTVSFYCYDNLSGVATCPPDVQFDHDGVGQSVVVTSTDVVGNTASQTVVVNIDSTVPTLDLDRSFDGTATMDTSITLTAAVTETTPSGNATVRCLGTVGSIAGGVAHCTIPLRPGLNSAIMSVSTAAGTTVSQGLTVTRTGQPSTLAVEPTTLTLGAADSTALTALSEYGAVMPAIWSSSDTNVLTVDQTGIVTALVAGTATITATAANLTARCTVTVLANAASTGSSQWTFALPDGMPAWAAAILPSTPLQDADPAMYAVTNDYDTDVALVVGVRAGGTGVGIEAIHGVPLFGDANGGVIVSLARGDQPFYQSGAAIQKISGSALGQPWRYEATGDNASIVSAAQAPDGTTYLVENNYTGDGNGDGAVVGVDSQTGQVKFKVPLPLSMYKYTPNPACGEIGDGGPPGTYYFPYQTSPLFVGQDGAAYLGVLGGVDTYSPVCYHRFETCRDDGGGYAVCERLGRADGEGVYTSDDAMKLLRVDATGATAFSTIWSWSGSSTDGRDPQTQESAWLGALVPDGLGGILMTWGRGITSPGGYSTDNHITRVKDGSITDHIIDTWPWIAMVGDNGVAYIIDYDESGNQKLIAEDIASWTTRWASAGYLNPFLITDVHHVLAQDFDNHAIVEIDDTGDKISSDPVTEDLSNAVTVFHNQGKLNGISSLGFAAQQSISVSRETPFTFSNDQPWVGSWNCSFPEYQTKYRYVNGVIELDDNNQPKEHWKNIHPGQTYSYRFMSQFSLQEEDEIRAAFLDWTQVNAMRWQGWFGGPVSSGPVLTGFREAAVTESTADILLWKQLPKKNTTVAESGAKDATWDHQGGEIGGGFSRYTTNTNLLASGKGYRKATLHEIGHFLGLTDQPKGPAGRGVHGASVMDLWGADERAGSSVQDDPANNVPLRVTVCDAMRAGSAPSRTWP